MRVTAGISLNPNAFQGKAHWILIPKIVPYSSAKMLFGPASPSIQIRMPLGEFGREIRIHIKGLPIISEMHVENTGTFKNQRLPENFV